ncbi:MAG: TIGR02221 family CRISPR-associated protein [Lachnospiraceae bacterium]|nr:TIGR02221 family CRISPR-associated protein [Lachnospiraceae bacterium]
MSRCERILILSLGTGTYIDFRDKLKSGDNITKNSLTLQEKEQRILDTYNDKSFNYRETAYNINNQTTERVAFVAYPLIKDNMPDKVIIIGTVKSSWSGFYNFFSNENYNNFKDYKTLYDIETTYGRDTAGEELKQCNSTIQNIFEKSKMFDCIKPGIDVRVILVRYGIDSEQLLENYEIISGIESMFEKGIHYEVSFDITHSFRSLPLYNLIVLNYLKNTTEYDIAIEHVYYGNLEVCSENKDVAPVVDLKELINVLNLTNGVSEFKNTGNSVSILNQMSDENPLKQILASFDWATQINDFDGIVKSLSSLMVYLNEKDKLKSIGGYADLEAMLKRVLSENLLDCVDEANIKIFNNMTPKNMAEMQYLLGNWYIRQNRYGQAIATALEALRSYLVVMYLEYKGLECTMENCCDENNRKASLDRLKLIDVNSTDENSRLLLEIEYLRERVKKIRDMFAHVFSLNNNTKYADINRIDESLDALLLNKNKKDIDDFMNCLSNLRHKINSDTKKEIYNIYAFSDKQADIVKSNKDIRFIVSNDTSDIYIKRCRSNYLQSKSSKKTYDVYLLPDEFAKKIKNECKNNVITNAILLSEYIKKYFTVNRVHVIMENNLKLSQLIQYSEILRDKCIENIERVTDDGTVVQLSKLELEVIYDESKYTETEKTMAILNLKPIKI